MIEVNLLARYPKAKRKLGRGVQIENHIIACQFGREYFDGTREQGYGGYRYDGRWMPIAQDIIWHFGLKPGDRVLDIGCAKGFLMRDLQALGMEVHGLDISQYAIDNCHPEVTGKIVQGTAERLPFPDKHFRAAICINTIHNLDEVGCLRALEEIERVAPGRGYVQVDAYDTPQEQAIFLDWVLTAKTHGSRCYWRGLFAWAGYRGAYFWTTLEPDDVEAA